MWEVQRMTTIKPQRPSPATEQRAEAPAARVGVRRIFAAETGNYFLLLGTTVFLVVFGLVMVLSSSSIESHLQNGSFFESFVKQGLFAAIGIPLMLVVSRLPIGFWKKWAWLGLGVGGVLQILVFTPLGFGYGGNRNWLNFGLFTMQPSELIKIALIVWIAFVLTSKSGLLHDWKHVLLPIGPVAGLAIGLVLLGQDLGTVVILLSIVFGMLFYAGVKLRYLGLTAAIIGIGGILFAFSGSSRTDRINAWLNGCTPADYERFCWQPTHGTWALASGGVFGVGLGNSKAKWSWLPEADNDYIFAIIGEELGLVGAIVVLLLFITLAVGFIRILRSNRDPFARLVTSGVMVWIIGQALVNIAVVLKVLPVLGVPLPLISAGGSALIASLLAIGMVLSFARNAPELEPAPSIVQTPAERSRLAAAQRVRPTL
jgi:cell division protein FtsW